MIELIRNLHRADLFSPFVIELSDGRAFPVLQRDHMAQAPSGRTLIVATGSDSFEALDVLSISRLTNPPVSIHPES